MDKIVILAVTGAVLFLLPVITAVYWKCKKKAHWKALLCGALGFIVSVRVLELLVHMVVLVADHPVSRAINGSTVLYVLYGTAMAGIFEEVGRWVIFSVFLKKMESREDAVFYGIGHGGIEVWTVTLPVVLVYLLALLGGSGLPAESAAMIVPMAEAFGIGTGICFVVERIFCMGIHISLTVLVFYGVRNRKKVCLLMAVLLHMILDVLPALYQRGAVGLAVTEVWLGVWCVLCCLLAHRLYRKL